MLIKMFLAFATSLFTGITLQTPRSAWLTVGLTGMAGWAVNEAVSNKSIPELVATVAGAITVGTMAEIMARIQKHPVTVYIVSGIIPLVPGTTAYNAMLAFLEKEFNLGLFLSFKAFLLASYLAAGLAIVPIIVRNIRYVIRRAKLNDPK
jgi:uncharacterized membrane protein YjjB (DUF3815 family)